jgi:Putative bacterial sensory transduction regulator
MDNHLARQRRTGAVVEEFLESHHLSYERVDDRTYMATLPGTSKLETHCALTIGDHSLGVSAFVIRKPDENSAEVHEWMLKRNASMYAVAFALNELGDIYLVGRLPHAAVTDSELDKVVGSVLQYADGAFNPLLELGFSSAIRREWAWRLSRGESLANLKAFEHLIS